MILVDTSVWISYLNGDPKARMSADDLLRVVTCPPILQEVCQGLRPGPASDAFRTSMLAFRCVGNPVSLEMYLEAAELFRLGRRKGYTIRAANDCLIATIAIREKLPLWHFDRDFESIARYTALETVSPDRMLRR